MPISVRHLAKAPLLAPLDGPTLAALAAEMREVRYRAGALIFLEGDAWPEVAFIAEGLVRLRQSSLEGREYVLGYLGPGAVLNLIAALDGKPTIATAEALTDCTLYCLPDTRFRAVVGDYATLAARLAEELATEVRRLSEMVKSLALQPVRARLARFLLSAAETAPGQSRWTQEMIAEQLGTVRDVVGRVLRAFAEEGLIRRERGQLVIVNREALEREANG